MTDKQIKLSQLIFHRRKILPIQFGLSVISTPDSHFQAKEVARQISVQSQVVWKTLVQREGDDNRRERKFAVADLIRRRFRGKGIAQVCYFTSRAFSVTL